ncbi:hypothetical protein [Flavobacterium lacus]|uniref:Uncharacterized protein n=1 Tax=Flavobacterium lacus TaxID=1353778 RepID=A0A328WMC7_9FLAO|nr:hypothetical protein [Flavobacterium lacus]RAR47401.1 hypothetical protein B0I10_10974 [Flavobacterium lacus]
MKKKFYILPILSFLIISLLFLNYFDFSIFTKKDKISSEIESEIPKSSFNLKRDFLEFKTKMNKSDTIKIWFDHSVCNFQGYERIKISKKSDSIYVISEFKDETFDDIPEWKLMYSKSIQINDTNWRFEDFIKLNLNRMNKSVTENDRLVLQIINKDDKIEFYTNGLVDYNIFLKDYVNIMRELLPSKKYFIHDVDIIHE